MKAPRLVIALSAAAMISASASIASACELRPCNDRAYGAGDCQRAQAAYQACMMSSQAKTMPAGQQPPVNPQAYPQNVPLPKMGEVQNSNQANNGGRTWSPNQVSRGR